MSEEGVCPKCDYPLTSGELRLDGARAFYHIECSECGFIGRQWYELDFLTITDDDGEEV